ncbi:hypothetical protein TPB0596_23130 [Tsukamurella pulmonis]|nr:hypothetical protein TPB0596_23130 [Tsukamurella pulmonis]
MDYRSVITDSLRVVNDEHIVSPGELNANDPIPSWWSDIAGPNGGQLLADVWDQLAPVELFPQTKALLRSERTLGVAILRSHAGKAGLACHVESCGCTRPPSERSESRPGHLPF